MLKFPLAKKGKMAIPVRKQVQMRPQGVPGYTYYNFNVFIIRIVDI